MKKIYFYKKNNSELNYCGWLFFTERLFKKKGNFINYSNHDFKKNNLLTEKYEKIIFNYLYVRLNKFHNVNYSKRYWKILMHNWVRSYVQSIIFRYDYIKKNIEISKFKKFYFKFNERSKKYPNFNIDFLNSLNDNDFNNRICYKVAENFCLKKKITIQKKNNNQKNLFKNEYQIFRLTFVNYFIRPILNFFCKFLIKDNIPILVSTYLPKKKENEYMIQSSYFFLWKNFFDINNYKINKLIKKNNNYKRNKFFKKIKQKNLKSTLINLLDDCFPTCFLEDFLLIKKFTKKKILKKKIKYLFTSNEFAFNDFFKFYLVELLSKGTKYFVGQHGSGYGSNVDQLNTIEESTSDKFFTWGWKYKKNHYPLGILQNYDQKQYRMINKVQKILVVHPNLESQRYVYDTSLMYKKSIETGIEILKICKENKFKNIGVRFHHSDFKFIKKYKKDYFKFNNDVKIDYGQNNIKREIDENTLVIFTYLSSGFYELLSLNCKCISIFDLDKKFFHSKFYNKIEPLKKNKIIFSNKKLLSEYVKNLITKDEFYFKKDKIPNNQKIFLREYGNIKNLEDKLESAL